MPEVKNTIAQQIRSAQAEGTEPLSKSAEIVVKNLTAWMTSPEGAMSFGNLLGSRKIADVKFLAGINKDDTRLKNSTLVNLRDPIPTDFRRDVLMKEVEAQLKAGEMAVLGYLNTGEDKYALIAFDHPKVKTEDR